MYGPPVDAAAYNAVSAVCGDDYAYSYLSKARQNGMTIEPFTHIAWERIRDNGGAMHALKKAGYKLQEPKPYYPGRDGPVDTMRPAAKQAKW